MTENETHRASWLTATSAESVEVSSNRPGFTLYPLSGIVWAAFWGMPLAASIVMAINYTRVGNKFEARFAIAVGLAVTAGLILFFFLGPESIVDSIPLGVTGTVQLLLVYFIAMSCQSELIANHIKAGGKVASAWSSFGIGIVCFLGTFVPVFVTCVLLDISNAEKERSDYIDAMTVDKGDIKVRDYITSFHEGNCGFRVAFDTSLPTHDVAGVDFAQFLIDWQFSILIDGNVVHSAKYTSGPRVGVAEGTIHSPKFPNIQGYIEKDAIVQVQGHQQGRQILLFEGKMEEREGRLDVAFHKSGFQKGGLIIVSFD